MLYSMTSLMNNVVRSEGANIIISLFQRRITLPLPMYSLHRKPTNVVLLLRFGGGRNKSSRFLCQVQKMIILILITTLLSKAVGCTITARETTIFLFGVAVELLFAC